MGTINRENIYITVKLRKVKFVGLVEKNSPFVTEKFNLKKKLHLLGLSCPLLLSYLYLGQVCHHLPVV